MPQDSGKAAYFRRWKQEMLWSIHCFEMKSLQIHDWERVLQLSQGGNLFPASEWLLCPGKLPASFLPSSCAEVKKMSCNMRFPGFLFWFCCFLAGQVPWPHFPCFFFCKMGILIVSTAESNKVYKRDHPSKVFSVGLNTQYRYVFLSPGFSRAPSTSWGQELLFFHYYIPKF